MNNEMPGTAGHSFHSFTVRFYIYQPISHIKRNERDLIPLALYSRTILRASNCHLRSIDHVNLSDRQAGDMDENGRLNACDLTLLKRLLMK